MASIFGHSSPAASVRAPLWDHDAAPLEGVGDDIPDRIWEVPAEPDAGAWYAEAPDGQQVVGSFAWAGTRDAQSAQASESPQSCFGCARLPKARVPPSLTGGGAAASAAAYSDPYRTWGGPAASPVPYRGAGSPGRGGASVHWGQSPRPEKRTPRQERGQDRSTVARTAPVLSIDKASPRSKVTKGVSLSQAMRKLAAGAWWLKWVRQRDPVHLRWVWVDRRRWTLYWAKTEDTRAFHSGAFQLSDVHHLSRSSFRVVMPGEHTQQRFWAMTLRTDKPSTCPCITIATRDERKFETWYGVVEMLTRPSREVEPARIKTLKDPLSPRRRNASPRKKKRTILDYNV
eukprot:Hpha_TRINITY_DN30052_c0_g1::TRINITY_DN30052_c0_g1_i1::g.21550::m.21550